MIIVKENYLNSFASQPMKQVAMSYVLNDQKKRFIRGPTAKKTEDVLMFSYLLHELYLIQEFTSLLFISAFLKK